MKILITGASGFLGKAIVEEFTREEFEVFTTSRSPALKLDSPNHFRADLTDRESVAQLEEMGEIDVVIHAAGLAHRFDETARDAFRRVNVEGTRNAANLAARLKAEHFVLISTVAVYGHAASARRSPPITETAVCTPRGDYAASKYEAEAEARGVCAKHRMNLTVLRPATIVGEGDPGNLLRLIRLVDKNRFVWVGAGDNLKTLIYKRDAARACRAVIGGTRQSGNGFEIYNVAAEPLAMREIVAEISGALGKTIPAIAIPENLVVKTLRAAERLTGLPGFGRLSETVLKWISEENFSGVKMRDRLGFAPEMSSREAVRREANFYKSAV